MMFDPHYLSLYLVTDSVLSGNCTIEDVVAMAVKGGVTMVQLREKMCTEDEYVSLALRLKSILKPFGIPLIINDNVAVALASGADGVHLGQSDGSVAEARALLGHDKIIGLSVESFEQAEKAEYEEVDYIAASPVFFTPTKRDTAAPFGLEGVRQLSGISTHPVVGIGGINISNVGEVMAAGAAGVAVVSAICSASDPKMAASELLQAVNASRQKPFRVGIIGAGHIADKICGTLSRTYGFSCAAVASRSIEKARQFAAKHNIVKAYGSYSELIDDDDIDLIYVATPHSHHFQPTAEALYAGKPCLVEKAFMANVAQTEKILDLSAKRNVFVAEAIWTRYTPALRIIKEILESDAIGDVKMIFAAGAYSMADKERVIRPELCGGALLDMGVYAINFIRMVHPADIARVESNCILSDTGVDMQSCTSFTLEDGVMANVVAGAECATEKHGIISGTNGYIVVDTASNPQNISIFNRCSELIGERICPHPVSGYEYEFISCRRAIAAGRTEPIEMPHSEILKVMSIMDDLRSRWGVRYPMDDENFNTAV